ncbi:MAG: deoxyribodipyrimidine photo-lyase [Bacteroidia bacterium]
MSMEVFWFRRDLRLNDNAGLYHALKTGNSVLPIFIFDKNILENLEEKDDARVSFIHQTLEQLKRELRELGSDLLVLHDSPLKAWQYLIQTYSIEHVYSNIDYEPYALERDQQVRELLEENNITFNLYKDHFIFDYKEILKDDGSPYIVFTPYSKKWKEKLNAFYLSSYPNQKYFDAFQKDLSFDFPSLESIGFKPSSIEFPAKTINQGLIKHYADKRNFPAINGTSKLSVHFRFGTLSIREKARQAQNLSETWLNELIWRDFYLQIMAHFPYAMNSAFKPLYDRIEWVNDTEQFQAWCEGKTGYGIVDAGMRELNTTGFMHNRVRMIVASFLCKHLLIDWRWGEAYFASKLLDFDLASNNGGWQWAASSGVDAAPYFRIFNPSLQTERFDPKLIYVKQWVPEYDSLSYPKPIIDHAFARQRCLETYKKSLQE